VHIFRDLPFWPKSDIPRALPGDTPCLPTRPRNVVWTFLNEIESGAGVLAFIVITSAIVLSILAFCAQSMPEYRNRAAQGVYGSPERAFDIIEASCVAVFSLDYALRLATCTSVPSAQEAAYIARFGWRSVKGKPVAMTFAWTPAGWARWAGVWWGKLVGFVLQPLNLVDLGAILPFYVTIADFANAGAGGGQAAIIRVLRLARILRLLRLAKGMEGVRILGNTIVAAVDALGFLSFFVLLACILMGSLVFFAEEGDYDAATGLWMRPDMRGQALEVSPFASIPHSFWYTMVTMTTTGYGDFYPTTPAGRVVGTLTMVIGILVLALPITVVGQAFTVEVARMRAHNRDMAAKEKAARATLTHRENERRKTLAHGGGGGVTAAAAAYNEAAGGGGGGGTAILTFSVPGGGPPPRAGQVAPEPPPSPPLHPRDGASPAAADASESFADPLSSPTGLAGGGLGADDSEALQEASVAAREAERGVRELRREVRELRDLVTRVLSLQGVILSPAAAAADDAPRAAEGGRGGAGGAGGASFYPTGGQPGQTTTHSSTRSLREQQQQ